jgi:Flp pilus assembly protein TadB
MVKFVNLEDFGKASIPKSFRISLKKTIHQAGYHEVPYKSYGLLFLSSIILTALIYIFYIYPFLKDLSNAIFMILTFSSWFLIQVLIIIFIIMLIYVHLDLKIYKRTKEMEDSLEEYLRYVSENLKGGMHFDKALWEAMRPQFGALTDEIGLVAKRVLTGMDISDALKDFVDKYNSPLIKRSFQLIIEGMKGGGNIAYIIDRVEKDIRETKDLRAEMKAANTTYMIFLGAIIIFIAPGLFALSYNLLLVLKSISATLGETTVSGSMMNLSSISVDENSFQFFSIGALGVISLFASMILSYIQKGNIKSGLKYIPMFVFSSILVYLFLKVVFNAVFSGIVDL